MISPLVYALIGIGLGVCGLPMILGGGPCTVGEVLLGLLMVAVGGVLEVVGIVKWSSARRAQKDAEASE